VQLLFALTLLVSATLIFVVEFMFGKMVLPLLGGAPAVWNTCMVFYQAALLGGYVYAHLGARYLGPRRQAVAHLTLMALALVALPITLPSGWVPPGEQNPIPWLLLVLAVSLGLPFLFVSASAPMLQSWFSHTSHGSARDPYFLYAASNLGSLLGLLGYPLILESNLTLRQQSWAWAGSYVLLMLLTLLCALTLWRRRGAPAPDAPPQDRPVVESEADALLEDAPVTWLRRLRWIALALVPSSLLLGVTTHMSIDLVSFPLLWAIPLALYLLSFILVFARWHILPHWLMVRVQPLLIVLLAAVYFLAGIYSSQLAPLFILSLLTFFVTAMVCHGELANDRPAARHLTEFYLWMSLGGVLGGLFNALLAPVVFKEVFEFPLMLAAACLVRPSWRAYAALDPADGLSCPASRGQWARWLLLGAIPACLLLGLATVIRQDAAAARLLWLAPVGIYLASLLPAFAPRRFVWQPLLPLLGAAGLVILAGLHLNEPSFGLRECPLPWVLGAFTLIAMACHGSLALARPTGGRAQWSAFLLAWTLGPATVLVLGAAKPGANALLSTTAPLAIGMAFLGVLACKQWDLASRRTRLDEWVALLLLPLAMGLALDARQGGQKVAALGKSIAAFVTRGGLEQLGVWVSQAAGTVTAQWVAVSLLATGLAALLLQRRRVRLAVAVLAALFISRLGDTDELRPAYIDRSFFGVLRVRKDAWYDAYKLLHGSTSHGMQSCDEQVRREPWTYYHREGPIGDIFLAIGDHAKEIGVVGLGTGTLAAYGRDGQRMTFFEIDPAVLRIARDRRFFHYLAESHARLDFVLGDARVQLARIDRAFDLLLIDAFSSDSIPVHLITKEAIDLYFKHLTKDGLLAVHISNRHLDLEPVLRRLGHECGRVAIMCEDNDEDRRYSQDQEETDLKGKFGSTWVVLARRDEDLAGLRVIQIAESDKVLPRWVTLEAKKGDPLWSDDFSNILGVLKWTPDWEWLNPKNWVD